MKNLSLRGTGVAVITPFHRYGTIDFSSLGRIIEHLITNGVDYLVTLGTTSEAATLSNDEKNAVVDFMIDTVDNRVPIVLGLGGNNTQEVTDLIGKTDFSRIEAILSVSPYYNKPRAKGIYIHFKAIANASPVPVILYNVPSRTSCNIPTPVVLDLARDFENIIGIKEASGDLAQVMDIIDGSPDDFLVISGDDLLTFPMMALGADGVISVAAHAFPSEFSEMVRLADKGRIAEAREIHYRLKDIINLFFIDGNPAGIKSALEVMGLCSNVLRLPLVKASKSTTIQIKDLIGKFKQVVVG